MKISVSAKINCSLPSAAKYQHKAHKGTRRHLRESILHLVVHGLPKIAHGLHDQVTTVSLKSKSHMKSQNHLKSCAYCNLPCNLPCYCERGLQVVCGHAVEFSLPQWFWVHVKTTSNNTDVPDSVHGAMTKHHHSNHESPHESRKYTDNKRKSFMS